MRKTALLLFLFAIIAPHCLGQGGQAQRALDEQLASTLFQSQDYEQAGDLYRKLYKDSKQAYLFNQYIECLFRMGSYDEAERELKSFIRNNANSWRAKVDLVYSYRNNNKQDKAKQLFDEILKGLPDSRNSILNISNLFRSRMLYDLSLAILEKGAQINTEQYPFYMERASLYHSMNNYQQAFEYYFLELEARPEQYSLIKNRFQTLLLYDVNKSIADEMRIALLKKTQENPDNKEFAQMLVWFALQEEDYEIALAQCKSIDRKYNDQDAQIISLAHICYDNGQYDIAQEAFEYLTAKGKINPYYGDALIGTIKTENQRCKINHVEDQRTYERLSKKIESAYTEVGSNEYPDLAEIQADIMAYHLDKAPEATELLLQAIGQTANKIKKNQLKLKLADIYLFTDEVWEATLLYSQVDKEMKEEPLGHEARFRNAQLRYFIGEFAWAQTQLNVLKAATSKLVANDAMSLSLIIGDNLEYDTTGMELARLARADFRIYQHKEDQAIAILDSICLDGNEISKPHALFRIAELKEKSQDYLGADSLYLQVVTAFPDSYMADDALMHAALIEHQRLNDKEAAKHHYEQLIDEYPTSLYTAQAKKNYRKL